MLAFHAQNGEFLHCGMHCKAPESQTIHSNALLTTATLHLLPHHIVAFAAVLKISHTVELSVDLRPTNALEIWTKQLRGESGSIPQERIFLSIACSLGCMGSEPVAMLVIWHKLSPEMATIWKLSWKRKYFPCGHR